MLRIIPIIIGIRCSGIPTHHFWFRKNAKTSVALIDHLVSMFCREAKERKYRLFLSVEAASQPKQHHKLLAEAKERKLYKLQITIYNIESTKPSGICYSVSYLVGRNYCSCALIP